MYDVIIVGGGPAGQSAAIFTSKDGRKTLVLDDEKGLTKLALVRNHYGTENFAGPDMVEAGRKKAENFGAAFKKGKVANVTKTGDAFKMETKEGDIYETSYVIMTTGANQQLAETIGLKTKSGDEPYINKVITVDEAGRTSMDGIWAGGAAGGISQHTIITSGDGARVATNLLSDIKGERHVDHDEL